MAANLPGIRAQAELDLSLIRQQQAQLNAILAEVGTSFQRIPAARFSLDATGAQRAATASSAATAQMAAAVERDARRAQAALDRANREAANVAIRESARATQAVEQDFNRRLAAADRAARAQVRLAREAAQQQDDAQRAALRVAGVSGLGLGVGFGLGAAGAGIASQLRDAGSAAADFEKAMSGVKAVLSPSELAASGAQLEQLALALGQQGLGFGATQAAAALEEMSKAGISAREQLAAAPAVLAGAAAGNVSVAQSAAFAANAMTVFGKAGSDIPGIMDQIVGAAAATTADVNDLQQAFGQFGAVAKLSNQSVESTVTAIALLAQAGIKGSDAGTSLRTMFLRLQPSTVAAADAMRHYGIIQGDTNRFIDQSTGKFKSAADVAQVLQETLGRLSDAERQMALETIFGSDAIRAGAVFAEQGAAGWQKLTAAIGETTAIGVARERLNNLRGDTANLGAAWENLRIVFGRQIEPNLRPVVQQITALTTALAGLSPQAQQTLLVIAGGVGAFAAVAGAALTTSAALALLDVSVGAIGAAALTVAAPIAVVAAAITVLGVAWVNDWGNIRETTSEATARITADMAVIGRAADALRAQVTQALAGLGTALSGVNFDTSGLGGVGAVAGDVLGRSLRAGFAAAFPVGGALLGLENLLHGEADKAAATAAEEGKRIGADFVDNLANALIAEGAVGDAAERLVAEFTGRGFTPEQAREAAELYADTLAFTILGKQSEIAAAGAAAAAAALGGLESGLANAPAAADALTRAFHDLTLAKNDLNQALGFAGTDQEAIAALLEIKAATEGAGASVDQLADRSIAAAVIALRNQANEAQDAAEKIGLLRQAQELLTGHLAAQETTARALGRTQGDAANQARQQAEAERQLGEAIQRVPLEAFNARAQQLIGATLPSLTQETGNLIQTLLVQGQTYQAVQIAAAAFGASQEDVQAILHGTGLEAATAAEHIKRLADTADPVAAANKAIEDSAKSMLQTLSAGLPAADRAWLQYVAAREGDRSTLRSLYQRMGGDLAAFDQASEAQQRRLIDRAAQARASAEALRSTGRPNAAPADPGIAERREAEDRARTAAREAADIAVRAQRQVEDRRREDSDAAAASRASETAFTQRQGEIVATLQHGLAQIDHARGTAFADFARQAAREAEDFNRTWERQQRDFAQADLESLRSFRESAGDALVGAASQFHDAAADAVQGLLGLSGGALRSAAAGIVDRFAGVSDAAQQASQQIADAQTTMLERVRDTFQSINRQAADTARGIREQLLQAGTLGNPATLFGNLLGNLPGQGSPEQQAALKATEDRNQAILAANLKQAATATQQQNILTSAQQARSDIDKQAADAEKDLQKQLLDQAKQAHGQRQQMIEQLARQVEAFNRQDDQVAQQRVDQFDDIDRARTRQEEDQARALGQTVTQLNQQFAETQRQASQQAEENRRRLEQERAAAQQAERDRAQQRRREDEDLELQRRRGREDRGRDETRRSEDRQRDREFAHQGELLERIARAVEREDVGVEQNFDLRESVFVEPATELLEIAARRLEERVAARTAG